MIRLEAYKYNIKLDQPLSISFHTWNFQENVIVYLTWNGKQGIGEAAPFKPITGDSQNEVIQDILPLSTLPFDPTKDSLDKLHEFLNHHTRSQTLKAAIDFAYHDLRAKLKGIPVYQLYVNRPTLVPNSVTIFIKESLEETVKEAQRILKVYPDLQIIKIKLKGKNDIERVKAIKSVCPHYMQFIVDANQGFINPQHAVEELNRIGEILKNVILVEEPCPKGETEKLFYVKDNVKNMLVFADESAATYEDAKKVIAHDAAHGINIKLQKAGGIWPGKKIAQLCKNNNLKIMVGSMLDGPIATAASVHFAVSTQNVILSDLDMDLDVADQGIGRIAFNKGSRIPSHLPGLGIVFDKDKIRQEKATILFEKII